MRAFRWFFWSFRVVILLLPYFLWFNRGYPWADTK